MNQNEQMRDALNLLSAVTPFDDESEEFLRLAESKLKQSFTAEPDHIPDDTKMVKPAPLVRLTDDEVHAIWSYTLLPMQIADAIMDAMIKKNGGAA